MKKVSIYVFSALVTFGVLGALYYGISPLFKNVYLDENAPQASTVSSNEEHLPFRAPIVGTTGHSATGTVSVLKTNEGTVLRYENFKTINGPDLFVYLSTDLEATEFVSLGALKATEGNINYEVPADIDIEKYRYALVWCKQFGVLFNSADLSQKIDMNMHDTKKMNTQMGDVISNRETALFANGCFWCVEHDLEKVAGVIEVVSGYAGGTTESPTYETYHDGGHREVVEVTFDPQVISYGNLVEHIIKHGNPTDGGGSFYDRGSSYAPAIYYKNEQEKSTAEEIIAVVDAAKVFDKPLAILVLPATTFWPAEEYHQDYSEKNPLRYNYYRAGSGRTKFIESVWGDKVDDFTISEEIEAVTTEEKPITTYTKDSWDNFVKPSEEELKTMLDPLAYSVTQEEGTERAGTHPSDKNYEAGIYVDVVSGEPLFSSRDKYDSGTGWPSFVKPIATDVVALHEDKRLFTTRTEVRSAHADSHLGHVFDDGPKDRGGKRYCMNGVALRFIPKAQMEQEGYGYLLSEV